MRRAATEGLILLFESAISDLTNTEAPADIDPIVYEAMIEGMRSQLEELKAAVKGVPS